MRLRLLGLNHKSASIGIREKVAFTEEQIPVALEKLYSDYGLKEAMLLSTCNRVELIVEDKGKEETENAIKDFLSKEKSIDIATLDKSLYSFSNRKLIEHVFSVASSLDSMVPGESQILGQMKQAFHTAQKTGTVGGDLGILLPHAFFVAKKVRSETQISENSVSVSSVAVELARKIFGDLAGRTVLLLGAGKMAELAAKSLLKSGVSKLIVVNRTASKAEEIASKFGGSTRDFSQLKQALIESDIVLVSTGSSSFVLGPHEVESALRSRKYSPLFMIDISVPRNIDPAVNDIEDAFLYDIDDLQSVVSSNLEERGNQAKEAARIIEQAVDLFQNMESVRDVGPLVSCLRQKIESICLDELDKSRNGFTPQECERIEKMMLRTAHRIAHPLLVQMKRGHENPNRHIHNLAMIREAFGLTDEEDS